MRSVGVRELKEHTSQILRLVSYHHEEIEVTHRGQVIARLVPATVTPASQDLAAVWSDLDQLAAEIGIHWPRGVSAVDAVCEERREL